MDQRGRSLDQVHGRIELLSQMTRVTGVMMTGLATGGVAVVEGHSGGEAEHPIVVVVVVVVVLEDHQS